jgi:DtxR family transcriptional regulator, manganese transport regulator
MAAKPKTHTKATDAEPHIAEAQRPTILVEADAQADHHRQTRRARQTAVVEDYVEMIADLIDKTGEARGVDISRHLGVTNATVNKMVNRLQQNGLVKTEPYRAIFLTEEGRRMAEWSRRRHEVVLAFLQALGISEETARGDAEGMEHHVSDETLAAFKRVIKEKSR